MNHLKPLFARVAEGNEKAFNEIYHTYHPILFSRIRRLIRHTTDAQDITQEVFIQLWLQGAALKEVQQPLAWLNRVAINLSINYLRRQQSLKNLKKMSGYLQPDTIDSDQNLSFKQLQLLMQEGINQLPADKQTILKLHLERGWGPKLIAAELNASPNSVRKRLETSRNFLRSYIKERVDVWLPWILIAAGCTTLT